MSVESRLGDPALSTPEGIVCAGGKLTPDWLRDAYLHGIFPWPMPGMPLLWFCPPERAILETENLHISDRLSRWVQKIERNKTYTLTIDQAFDQVIANCANLRDETWITADMQAAYKILHRAGDAHSFEIWNTHQELVGGLYGVSIGGTFSAESMFYREPNASKLALIRACEYFKKRGLKWIDIQVLTPHMEKFGARLITRDSFLEQLTRTQALNLLLFDS